MDLHPSYRCTYPAGCSGCRVAPVRVSLVKFNLPEILAAVEIDRGEPVTLVAFSAVGADVGRFDNSIGWVTVRYGAGWVADYGILPDWSVSLWAD